MLKDCLNYSAAYIWLYWTKFRVVVVYALRITSIKYTFISEMPQPANNTNACLLRNIEDFVTLVVHQQCAQKRALHVGGVARAFPGGQAAHPEEDQMGEENEEILRKTGRK